MADDIHIDDVFVRIVDDEGNVTGVMDQMTADFLASNAPDPTQASLDAAFDGVTRARLLGLRHDERYAVFDVPVLDVTNPDDLAELSAALRIAEADEYGHCMCIGDHELELWVGERVVHTLSLHHWTAIRWETVWAGDADLADAGRFADWLLRFGITEARDHLVEMEELGRVADEYAAVWERAMPPSLRPLWPGQLCYANDLGAVGEVLEAAVPDPVARVRALYAWFGSLARGWNTSYQYEEVPEALLLEYSIEVLLEAADTDSDAELVGAARIFSEYGIDYRRPGGPARYPVALRQRMMDAVERQGIAENVALLRAAFDSPGS